MSGSAIRHDSAPLASAPLRAKALHLLPTHRAETVPSGAVFNLRTERARRLSEGAALRKILDARDITLRCFAGWVDVDERVVRDWCNGLRSIPEERVKRMRSVESAWREAVGK